MKIRQIEIVITLIFCVFVQTACTQKEQTMKEQTMLQKENLKGKVKTVYAPNGSDYDKTYFDETGKIIKKESKRSSNPLFLQDNYIYDNKGCLISFIAYREDNPNSNTKLIYEYNDRGLVERFGTGDSFDHYEYDKKGNCVLETTYYNTKRKRIYNEKNQVIEEFSYGEGGEKLHSWGTDKNGKHWEKDELTKPWESDHTFYEYNEFGDISRITEKNKEEKIKSICVRTYKYDDMGNWIECRFQGQSGDSLNNVWDSILTRIIEYYE